MFVNVIHFMNGICITRSVVVDKWSTYRWKMGAVVGAVKFENKNIATLTNKDGQFKLVYQEDLINDQDFHGVGGGKHQDYRYVRCIQGSGYHCVSGI